MRKVFFISISLTLLFIVFMESGCNDKPDLVVSNITIVPTAPNSCEAIRFEAVIKNRGTKMPQLQ